MQLKKIMRKSSPQKKEPTKKLSKQEKQSKKRLMKEAKKQKQRIEKASKRFEKQRQKYINFLKAHNMWSEELERKYNPKKIKESHLLMDEFSEAYATRIARARVNKAQIAPKKAKYGDNKKKDYDFHRELVAITEEICRANGWMTKEEMDKHNVPIEKYMRLLVQAATTYADVLKYYAKQWYDERRDKHMG